MVTLSNFSSSRSGEMIIGEKDGRICALPVSEIDISKCTNSLSSYPEINIVRELFHSTASHINRDDRRSLMVPVNETLLKKATRIFFEENLSAALNEVTKSQNNLVSSMAKYILHLVNAGNTLRFFLRPHLKDKGVASIGKFSQTRDWQRSPIRFIKWHPNCFKLAVAASDDSIRVYTDEPSIIPVLKSGLQKCVSSMAWRPYSAGELAVGCHNGVLIWSLDPNSHITRPLSQATHLKNGSHFPVTSVDWSPDGCLLVTASINDSDVLVWDVDQNRNTPLKRVGPPCSLLKWSPDGFRLFSATVGNVFRVWTTSKWLPERWTVGLGAIQSIVWSPCGSHLLFVTTDDPFLYTMRFVEEQLFNSSALLKQALPIADLSRTTIGRTEVGGRPQTLAWCPKGQHLAIMFKDSAAITIFKTTISRHNFNISPSYFLNGVDSEYPSFICFQENYSRTSKNIPETVLTIGWSSGHIQYFPFI